VQATAECIVADVAANRMADELRQVAASGSQMQVAVAVKCSMSQQVAAAVASFVMADQDIGQREQEMVD